MRNTYIKTALAVTIAFVFSGAAFAGTDTSNLGVSASVAGNCTIDATGGLAFGAYDPVGANGASGVDLDNSGSTISTTCTKGFPATITLGQGLTTDGGSTDAVPLRQMVDGSSNVLAYNIYSDASFTTVWDGTTGVGTTGTGVAVPVSVYGRITKGQAVPVGSYTDTVIATVTF